MSLRCRAAVAVAVGASLLAAGAAAAQGFSLRFFGSGVAAPQQDRVKIRIDDETVPNDPGPPVDVGATDFSIEFWMRASAADNDADSVTCGANIEWINGNILLDRDRFNQDRKFGISIAGGVVVFGLSGDGTGDYTICGTTDVLDDQWHHVAVQRRRADGRMWLFVDGSLEGEADGPDGDISYPDDGVPGPYCGGPCDDSDPFIVLGAEKHDAGAQFPSYAGRLDDLRFSDVLRHAGAFAPPAVPYVADADTVGLYAFDEGPAGDCTGTVLDAATVAGAPTDGACFFGGPGPAGPVYTGATPFVSAKVPAAGDLGRAALATLLLGVALCCRHGTSSRTHSDAG